MTAPRLVDEPGTGTLEVWELEPREDVLERLLTELFRDHWRQITFGPLIQGAAWELAAPGAPTRIGMQDGYLTVDFGPLGHFHLCIGEHRGEPGHPTPPALAAHRRTSQAHFYRRINADGTPDSWGLRLLNGKGEEQITVLFPNPFLTREQRFRAAPDWSALALWDRVRKTYLGLDPDPRDRSGRRLVHP
jgi:hypothetical protein